MANVFEQLYPPFYSILHLPYGELMSDNPSAMHTISREAEIIVCYRAPHAGVWVRYLPSMDTTQDLRVHRTALEMAVGQARVVYNVHYGDVRHNNAEPLTVRIADDQKWAFLMGLVVCGLAERIQIP